jgi:hypothetical protein
LRRHPAAEAEAMKRRRKPSSKAWSYCLLPLFIVF